MTDPVQRIDDIVAFSEAVDIPTTAYTLAEFPGLNWSATGVTLEPDRAGDGVALGALHWVAQRESMTQWQVGDLALIQIAADGGDPTRTYAALREHGYTQAWLSNAVAVAEAVAPERRRTGRAGSWTHHATVAHLDPDDQDRLLGTAQANRWTVHQLQEQVDAEARAGQEELDTGDRTRPARWRNIKALVDEQWRYHPTAPLVLYPDGRVLLLPEGDEGS